MKKIYACTLCIFFFACTATVFAQVTHTEKITGTENLVKVDPSSIDPKLSAILKFYDKQIYFTENKGQWPDTILYKADFPLGQALVTSKGMIVGTYNANAFAAHNAQYERKEKAQHDGIKLNEEEVKVPGHGWLMNFVNHSDSMYIESKTKHSDYFNYFVGRDASKYSTNVCSYQEIWYKNVYNNVDVRYYPSETGTLEYDIVCKPGFNKNNIAIQLTGINKMYLKNNGHLVLKTSVGDMEFPSPVAYQKINGVETPVEAKYVLKNNVLSFNIGNYDETQPLIIDPIALRWATWMTNNSSQANHNHCIWVDQATGYIYVVARVASAGLITVNAIENLYEGAGGDENEIGEYIEPDTIGNPGQRIWQTYLGSAGTTNPYALTQANNGDLIFTGYTQSGDYPLLYGTYYSGTSINDAVTNGDEKIYITKINTAGNSFKSAVIGGNGNDESFDIGTTSNSDILVCGNTTSSNLATKFLGTGATNITTGRQHVIVFRIDNNLDSIEWMKDYGGTGSDGATIMNTNLTTGELFVAGTTTSTNFPVTGNARQAILVGTEDGFIQKLDSGGNTVWSSYFQAAAGKYSEILAMELNTTETSVYFAGLTTGLAAANVSASNVYQPNIAGVTNYFVAQMDTNQNFDEATYLGGGGEAEIMGLNTDLNNAVYVLGYTSSTNFPVTTDALQLTNLSAGDHNETFTKLSSSLDSLVYSTYYGGSVDDYDPIGERGIRFYNCRIFTVFTSESDNVPLTAGAITTTKLSPASIYEPGIAVWANPPDLADNTITGSQQICSGTTPSGLTGTAPSYVLPKISRDNVTSAYPANLNAATTYQWQYSIDSINWNNVTGGTTQNLNDTLIGSLTQTTYFRRIIGGDACVIAGDSDQVTKVNVIPIPNISITPPSTTICVGQPVTLAAKGATTYQWKPSTGLSSSTSSTVQASPTTNTTYTVIGNPSGCSDTTTVPIRVIQDSLMVSNDNPPVCQGNSVVIIASGASNYAWSPSTGLNQTTGSTVTVTPDSTTSYTLTATGSNGCLDTITPIVVNINQPPVLTIAPITPQICIGQSIQFTVSINVSGTATYRWSPSTGLSQTNGSAVTANPTATTTYTVYGTDALGCNDSTNVVLVVNPLPIVTITPPDSTICRGYSTTLIVNGASTYEWSPSNGLSSTTNSNIQANPTITTTYTVIGTSLLGCRDTATVPIRIIQDSLHVSTNNPSVCQGNSVVIIATGANSYNWSPATGLNKSTGDTVIAAPTTTTSYTLIGTGIVGCLDTENVVVNVNLPPVLNIVPSNPTICIGHPTRLAVSGAETYHWSPSTGLSQTTGSTVSANPTTATTYTAYGTDALGCNDSTKVVIKVNPLPSVIVAPLDSIVCNGLSVPLTAIGASTYKWSPSSGLSSTTNSAVVAAPLATTTYTVYGTDTAGCIDTVTAVVNIIPNSIVISVTPPNAIICLGNSDTLKAKGGINYSWSPSKGLNQTNDSIADANPTLTTTYTVIGIGIGNCSDTTDIAIIVSPPPSITIQPTTPVICDGQAISLTASGASTYEWKPSTGLYETAGSTVDAHPTDTTSYTIYGTDSLGCNDSTKFTLDVEAAPLGSFTSNVPSICYPLQIQFSNTSSGGISYLWNFGDGATSTNQNPSHEFSKPGIYMVTLFATSANGCVDTVTEADTLSNYSASVLIPNSFTPTVDGVNQRFKPNVECIAATNYVFRVYDRWGILLYESEDADAPGWDGTYKGKPESLDVYVYYIQVNCGICSFFKKGDVTLLK